MVLSKELKNCFIVEGDPNEVKRLLENLRNSKEFLMVEGKVPSQLEELTNEYIDSNWHKDKNLYETIFYARLRGDKILLTFINEEFQNIVMEFLKIGKYNLFVNYIYALEVTSRSSMLMLEEYDNIGDLIEEYFLPKFKTSNYSFKDMFNQKYTRCAICA